MDAKMRMHLVGDEVEEGGIGRADSKVAIARHALQDQQVLWADAELLQALVRRQVDICAFAKRVAKDDLTSASSMHARHTYTCTCAPSLP